MKKRIFKISKAIHKYLGLILLLYLMWMSITGILLNHPKAISSFSMPKSIIPEYYHVKNWHRGALRDVVFTDSVTGYAYGKQGIFKTTDSGRSFTEFMDGDFPDYPYNRKTTGVYHDKDNSRLLAATKAGFFKLNLSSGKWTVIESLKDEYDAVRIIATSDKLIAVTRSDMFVCNNTDDLIFEKTDAKRDTVSEYMSLTEFFFMLHDGTIWGIPGKILWDIFALILLFLSVTAFYLWFWPKKWRRLKKRNKQTSKRERKIFTFFFKYHLKLGVYAALFLLIIVVTGMFIHPPLVVAISKGKIKKSLVPGIVSKNPWNYKIRNIMYDHGRNKIIIDADGLWEADANLNQPFEKSAVKARIFAMGATVFRCESDSTVIVGSFGGLQRFNTKTGEVQNMLPDSGSKGFSRGGFGGYMVTGYFKTSDGREYFNSHTTGLFKIDGSRDNERFIMPEALNSNYRMSLWNYAFETHNGRIFKSLVGMLYFFINPLFGLLTVLVLISGTIDWLFRRRK
jgi:hypothetical protein